MANGNELSNESEYLIIYIDTSSCRQVEIFNVDAADGSLSLNQSLELPPDRDDALTSSRGRGDTACMEYR